MRFGTFHIVQWHESKSQEQSIQEALEQIELADELGFDAAWVGEHHFSRHGLVSGIFPLLGNIAARTKRIKLGTAVVVLPFHNPILTAQEAATVDVISGGRLLFGVGSGYQRQEFEGMGVDVEEARDRFREYLDVIIAAWSGRPEDRMTHKGRFVDVEELWTMPKPLQRPHPPLYVAVSTSPETVDYAASRNMQIIVGGPTAVMGQAPDVVKLWHSKMESYGHEHDHLDPPVSMGVYVAPTMEEAERDPVDRADFSTKILAQIGSPIGRDGKASEGLRALGQPAARQEDGLGGRSDGRRAQSLRHPRGRSREARSGEEHGDQPHHLQLRLPRPAPREDAALPGAVRLGGDAPLRAGHDRGRRELNRRAWAARYSHTLTPVLCRSM